MNFLARLICRSLTRSVAPGSCGCGLIKTLVALGLAASCVAASAQTNGCPNKPMKVIVPFSPGGSVDGPMRGIAGMQDLIDFFVKLPSADKQFTVMNGISHASFQQKNYLICCQILHS